AASRRRGPRQVGAEAAAHGADESDLHGGRRRREFSLLPPGRHPRHPGLGHAPRRGRQPRGLPAARPAARPTAPMIAIAVGLALVAAVFHGTWNVLVKVSGDPITTFRRASYMAAVVATLSIAPAWLILGKPVLTPAAVGF